MDQNGSQSYTFLMGKKETKQTRVTVRFNQKDFNRVQALAKIYAGGNIARWLRHGALEAERKFLK